MKQPDPSVRVYRIFYPTPEPGDPSDFNDFGNTFLVPELDSAVNRYYGILSNERRCRRPGVNYNDPGWRNRLCQHPFQYHRELFRVFEQLHLTARDINTICNWWGTMTEVDLWERRHPGRVIHEDPWEGIHRYQAVNAPAAFFHEPVGQSKPVKRRPSRIKRLFSRPRAIRSWRDLHRLCPTEEEGFTRAGVEQSLASSDEIEGAGYDEDDDAIENSVGVPLNQQLRAGIRNTEFEDWLKEEAESGNLASYEHSANYHQPPVITPNTISYSTPNYQASGSSYSQRMVNIPYPGDMHTLPVAVTGSSDSNERSSQTRQTSLARYRTTPYHFRPIRPRPARNTS